MLHSVAYISWNIFYLYLPGNPKWHPLVSLIHSGAQRTEGLFGALIVRENETIISQVTNKLDKFQDLPENHTLTFLDWQYENSIDLFTQIHSSIRFFL